MSLKIHLAAGKREPVVVDEKSSEKKRRGWRFVVISFNLHRPLVRDGGFETGLPD